MVNLLLGHLYAQSPISMCRTYLPFQKQRRGDLYQLVDVERLTCKGAKWGAFYIAWGWNNLELISDKRVVYWKAKTWQLRICAYIDLCSIIWLIFPKSKFRLDWCTMWCVWNCNKGSFCFWFHFFWTLKNSVLR